mmetsp:Transcript_12499/g.14360  ORF Transcript_12499/g.14360 Transcript_12499/m.14360 type:complete len:391 (+) Transcript_12499:216-1388(+)
MKVSGFVLFAILGLQAVGTMAFDGPFEDCEIYDHPRKGVCNDRGICVNDTCQCEDGFTGLSDFINTEGLDCQINELIVDCLWGFLLFAAVVGQLLSVPKFLDRYRRHKERGHPLKKNKILIAIILYETIVVPSVILAAILKLADKSQRVGVTPGITVFFFTGKFGFYLTAFFIQPALTEAMMKGSKLGKNPVIDRIIRIQYVGSFMMFVISSLLALLPFITIANGGVYDETAEIVHLAYFGGSAFSMFAYSLQCVFLIFKINGVMKPSGLAAGTPSDDKLEQTRKALVSFQKQTLIQQYINGGIFTAFAAAQYMWNRHDYYFPLSWVVFIVLGKKLADTHVGDKSSSKGTGSALKAVGSLLVSKSKGSAAATEDEPNSKTQTRRKSSFDI